MKKKLLLLKNKYSMLLEKIGLTSFQIKVIAIIIMFIDHFAASCVYKYIMAQRIPFSNNSSEPIIRMYRIMRNIGRMAFPIFIFFLIIGFIHTKSKWKYLIRLFIFSLIAEIPFDLALHQTSFTLKNGIIEFYYQNVFFTLTLGFIAIFIIDTCREKIPVKWLWIFFVPLITFAFYKLGDFLRVDYRGWGVVAIIGCYLLKEYPQIGAILVCSILSYKLGGYEKYCFYSLIPIFLYNGKRGYDMKWFFYAFYPCHLLFIFIVDLIMRIY